MERRWAEQNPSLKGQVLALIRERDPAAYRFFQAGGFDIKVSSGFSHFLHFFFPAQLVWAEHDSYWKGVEAKTVYELETDRADVAAGDILRMLSRRSDFAAWKRQHGYVDPPTDNRPQMQAAPGSPEARGAELQAGRDYRDQQRARGRNEFSIWWEWFWTPEGAGSSGGGLDMIVQWVGAFVAPGAMEGVIPERPVGVRAPVPTKVEPLGSGGRGGSPTGPQKGGGGSTPRAGNPEPPPLKGGAPEPEAPLGPKTGRGVPPERVGQGKPVGAPSGGNGGCFLDETMVLSGEANEDLERAALDGPDPEGRRLWAMLAALAVFLAGGFDGYVSRKRKREEE
jgi:hypothetical protein